MGYKKISKKISKNYLAWGKKALLFVFAALAAIVSLLLIIGLLLNFIVEDSPASDLPMTDIDKRMFFKTHQPQTNPDYLLTTNTPYPALASVSQNIETAFTSQAPFGVWDEIHEETCEEAAIVMAYVWLSNLQLTPDFAETEMLKLVEWQKNNLGYFENTSAKDTAKTASEVYGLKYRLINNPSSEDVKREIADGNLVLMGMAGKKLANPFFKPPGPAYHMLLIRGFDAKGFFVNDPGTRRGNNFFYTYENLMGAAHDWDGSEETLLDSPPVAIVFSRNN